MQNDPLIALERLETAIDRLEQAVLHVTTQKQKQRGTVLSAVERLDIIMEKIKNSESP